MQNMKQFITVEKVQVFDTESWTDIVTDRRTDKHTEKKNKDIWPSPMTKNPMPLENKKVERQNKDATKNSDYTTTVHRLRTVNWSDYCHLTGGVNQFTWRNHSH